MSTTAEGGFVCGCHAVRKSISCAALTLRHSPGGQSDEQAPPVHLCLLATGMRSMMSPLGRNVTGLRRSIGANPFASTSAGEAIFGRVQWGAPEWGPRSDAP